MIPNMNKQIVDNRDVAESHKKTMTYPETAISVQGYKEHIVSL